MKVLCCGLLLILVVSGTLANLQTQYVKAQWQSKSANISLQPKTDHYCYDVQLVAAHASAPYVGFSIASLTARMQPQYYMQIRVRAAELSQRSVPVSLRLPYLINEWKSIGFYVIASSRTDIEVDTYRFETLSLTGCTNANSQTFSIGVMAEYSAATSLPVKVFLNGWELATKEDGDYGNTAFQVDVNNTYVANRTLFLTVNRLSGSEMYAFYITYFIVGSGSIKFESKVEFLGIEDKNTIALSCTGFTPEFKIFGFSAFSIQNTFDEIIDLQLSISGAGLSFASKSKRSFLRASASYFLLGSDSVGSSVLAAPYQASTSQVTTTAAALPISPGVLPVVSPVLPIVPPASLFQPTTTNQASNPCRQGCVTCGPSGLCIQCEKDWNNINGVCYLGNESVINNKNSCSSGSSTVDCDGKAVSGNGCAADQYKKNGMCLKLPDGAFWNGQDLFCKDGYYNLNGFCTPVPQGARWNGTNLVCKDGYYFLAGQYIKFLEGQILINGVPTCKDGYYPNAGKCDKVPIGAIFVNGKLSCQDSYYNNSGICTILPPNSYWNGQMLVCMDGFYSASGQCVAVPANSVWNGSALICKNGYQNVLGVCTAVPKNAIWDGSSFVCLTGFANVSGDCVPIPDNAIWNGNAFVCKEGFYNNSQACVTLPANTVWNGSSLVCADGYYSNGGVCTAVPVGATWNGTALVCKKGYYKVNDQYLLLPANTVWTGMRLMCADGCQNISGNCLQIPLNAFWNGTAFICKDGFFQDISGACKTLPPFSIYVLDHMQCLPGYKNCSGVCKPATGKTSIRFTGKAYVMGKVVLNVRVQNLPAECNDTFLANDFLTVRLVTNIIPAPEMGVRYIPGSKGSFSITMDFHGRDAIPPFMVKAGINQAAQNSPVFATIDTSEMKQMRVDTATMAVRDSAQRLGN